MLSIALPVTLAWIMFCVGLQLRPHDFYAVFKQPKWLVIGVFAQIIMIPALAFAMVYAFKIPSPIAIGLYLVALSPGGNTSNAISALAGGKIALSTTLTAITSLIIPFTFPFFLSFLLDEATLSISKTQIMLQLLLISAIPMVLGMLVNMVKRFDLSTFKKIATKTTLPGLFVIVLITLIRSQSMLSSFISSASFFVLLLCVLAMMLGLLIAKAFAADIETTKTLMIEVGIQNAGIAIFVAIHQLQDPTLAITPLIYGVLMNIPALLMIALNQSKTLKAAHEV